MRRIDPIIIVITSLAIAVGILGCSPDITPTTAQVDKTYLSTEPSSFSRDVNDVTVEIVAKGLKIPWSIAFAPDGRIFISENTGAIRVIKNGDLLEKPYASIGEEVVSKSKLFGLALDPDFENNGYMYVYHKYRTSSGLFNRVSRLKDTKSSGINLTPVIGGIPASYSRNGGRIKFGPDGKLYVATGDANIPSNAQDLTSLGGKILRINIDGSTPGDNPFGASPIYSYGHRNPQGLAWHPFSGQLLVTEQGPLGNDEVNLVTPGSNYGWPEVSGFATDPRYQNPILMSGIKSWVPSGSIFYRGIIMPEEWDGRMIFGTLRGQRLVWLTLALPESASVLDQGILLERRFGRIGEVSQGPDGFVYFSTSNLDGRGNPRKDDDMLLRIRPLQGSRAYLPNSHISSDPKSIQEQK